MRILVATLVGVALATSVSGLGAAEAKRPALRITDLTPLTVRGSDFKPGERVKLLVSAGSGAASRGVRAGPRGRFVTRFHMRIDVRCPEVVVQAIGAAGSRAMVELTRPGCDEHP